MGNSCTIQHISNLQSQHPSPSPSLSLLQTPELVETIFSHQKGDCLSQVNCQSVPTSAVTIPTLNVARPLKRPAYSINKQNLFKALQERSSPAPSPTKRAASKSVFAKLPANAQLKEKWSKESSFAKQNQPSFHPSVSEIYDDGFMEYSRDSESLKVEDLWQDVSKVMNGERVGLQNLEDRRWSEGHMIKNFSLEDYRRGSVETFGQNDMSPPRKNLKKEAVRMYQTRIEKEESNSKISLFGRVDNDKGVPSQEKKDVEIKLPVVREINYETNQTSSSQNDKEMRMVQGLTAIAQSFSPIKRSQNASPNSKSPICEDNPFREEKSLYSDSVSPFEMSPMKIQPDQSPLKQAEKQIENHSATKTSQLGPKHSNKYSSVGSFETVVQTGLYNGVTNSLDMLGNRQKDIIQEQNKHEMNPMMAHSAEKIYSSVRPSGNPSSREALYSSDNSMNTNDRTKKEIGTRKTSLMDRLMESLLEEKHKKDENKIVPESAGEEVYSPGVRRDPFEKDKKLGKKQNQEYSSQQQSGHRTDQSGSSKSVKYGQSTGFPNNTSNSKEYHSIKSVVLQGEADYDMNKPPKYGKSTEQMKKDVETHNSLASSEFVSRGTSPQPRSEVLDLSKEYSVNSTEDGQKPIKGKNKRVSENSFQKERGEIITDQKAIVQEIKSLQKEVFERMSVVTSNMRGKMLTPKKMLELRDIQDKIQILTHLGSMIEADQAKQNKDAAAVVAVSNRRPTSSSTERAGQPKPTSQQQKSQRSFIKDAKNYFSCSKPSSTSNTIKRNSSASNIQAAALNKSAITTHQSTEPDSSLFKNPTGGPSDSRSTQEFLESEMECNNNPQEVWKRQSIDDAHQKSFRILPYASEPKSSQKPVESSIARELSYQTVEPRPRKVTEVLSKSYLGHELSADNSCLMLISAKDSLRQSADIKDDKTGGMQNVIKKLSYAKNLSTYVTPQAQVKEPQRHLTPEPSAKSIKQPNTGLRRQSTAAREKVESRRTSTGLKEISSKSRVSSVEKIKAPVPEKSFRNDSYNQQKNQASNKRLSVGNSGPGAKEYSIDLTDYRKKSPLPKGNVENDNKRKINQNVQIQENNENVLEKVEENITNQSRNLDVDQADLLYEEIVKLDQKLAATKSTNKIAVVEDIPEKSPNRKTPVSDVCPDKINRRGSYTKQAVKKIERHMTPLVGRVNRPGPSQVSEIQDRRQTISNLSAQQEQSDSQPLMDSACADGKKNKFDYSQAIQMRIKYAEEAARKQTMAESTEWILNAKLPMYSGKTQDRIKKSLV